MADDSGTEKTSTSSQGVAHTKRSLLLAGGVVVLIALSAVVIWQAHKHSPALSGWLMPSGLTVVGLLALIILWKLPQWQVEHVEGLEPKERFDRVNEARKTLATILGGAVLLAGFFGTWQNLKVAQESASTSLKALLVSQENERTSQQALRVSQEGQITDRFTKAIELLEAVYPDGKPKLDVRLGAIYSLERIANDSNKDHWPIMEVLCTYVRVHAPLQQKQSRQAKQTATEQPPISPDIQAILTVLGRRNRSSEGTLQSLNLTRSNLVGANLDGASLSGAQLDDANLSRARLRKAHLSGVELDGADLNAAFLNGADLTGANLKWADLSDADLRWTNLRGADLTLARNLTQYQIDHSNGDSTTKLPASLHMPESWK